ncbi:MAG: type II secretion system F family protein, partial [Candidatus Thorarchaeota archaeon]
MPRVSQKTFQYSWFLSIALFMVIGFIGLVLVYSPFLQYTINNPITNYPKDTILKLHAIKIFDISVLNFSFQIDIMDITFVAILLLLVFPAYYYRKDHIWRNKIDGYLPYLLREIADAQKVGLPLPRAITEASKRQYGPLTEELKYMASKISWGVPFSDALRTMAHNINTPLFNRTSVLILEAERSGGQTEDIFESAYEHVNSILGLERERLSSMSPYKWIILISYVVFAIVLVLLLNSFFVELAIRTATLPADQPYGRLPMNLALLQLMFFHILMIEGTFAGIISGKMSTGNVKVGLINAIVMIILGF